MTARYNIAETGNANILDNTLHNVVPLIRQYSIISLVSLLLDPREIRDISPVPEAKGFYPRDAMLARVIAIATCLSVSLSVCLSVTRRYCVKTKKASGMISSPSGSPKTLVF